jgi:D-arginine dehydrogenase
MTQQCDFLVVGAGIAGASAAFELARHGSVILLEREDLPGYHTTGRSAALFTEAYGNRVVRALTVASRAFFDSPPDGFTSHPILTPRGALFVGGADQRATLDRHEQESCALVASVRRMSAAEACTMVPVLRPDYVAGAVYEPDAKDIDVNALHQGYLRGLKGRAGRLVCNAEVEACIRHAGQWTATTRAGAFAAPVLINAAGAWCDLLGRLAGAQPIGLIPKRRTAILFDAPKGLATAHWPLVLDVGEEWYFKPESGRLLGSPADETPSPPCDAQPDELDIALAADRIMRASTLAIDRIRRKWAGLRSFVADKTLVAGFDEQLPGFFWLAGQGGYGIQSAPAMAEITAALAAGHALPEKIAAHGISAAQLSPARLQR